MAEGRATSLKLKSDRNKEEGQQALAESRRKCVAELLAELLDAELLIFPFEFPMHRLPPGQWQGGYPSECADIVDKILKEEYNDGETILFTEPYIHSRFMIHCKEKKANDCAIM